MGRALIHLGEDRYVEWSTVVDAPCGTILTRAEVVKACLADHTAQDATERLDRLDRNNHTWCDLPASTPTSLVSCNRAGPRESCLTLDAIRRRYASPEAYAAFVLTPDDIAPYSTSYDDGSVYWVPWRPGQAPDSLDEHTDFHARVPFNDTELAELTRSPVPTT